jgi:hypothetical protein
MDIPTLLLAVYGAGLSTILGIREIRKGRRSLKIILESVHWMETFRIVITNPAERPITITEIHLAIEDKEGRGEALLRESSYWANEESYKPPALPLTLKDGEVKIFWLSEYLSGEIQKSKSKRLEIKVFDGEGHIYSKYGEGEYDPKYGYRTGKYKPPNIFARTRWKIRSIFKRLQHQ